MRTIFLVSAIASQIGCAAKRQSEDQLNQAQARAGSISTSTSQIVETCSPIPSTIGPLGRALGMTPNGSIHFSEMLVQGKWQRYVAIEDSKKENSRYYGPAGMDKDTTFEFGYKFTTTITGPRITLSHVGSFGSSFETRYSEFTLMSGSTTERLNIHCVPVSKSRVLMDHE